MKKELEEIGHIRTELERAAAVMESKIARL
jgi:hypothetical protein